jgi:hypothetical protein
MVDPHPRPEPIAAPIQLGPITPSASPEETAAIVAALERFRRSAASPTASGSTGADGWLRAAILEGVSRQISGDPADPWRNT